MKFNTIFLLGSIFLISNLSNAKSIVKRNEINYNDITQEIGFENNKYTEEVTQAIEISDNEDIAQEVEISDNEDIIQEIEISDNEDITQEIEIDYHFQMLMKQLLLFYQTMIILKI